jgi:glycosyltransferase involved in cell wall biosynthesis
MKQVTVIVPFYNVEAYIGECLESLVNQTYRNIEILCIDDCSVDSSLDIAASYADRDPRLRIIRHKQNKGLGGARNTGIINATGEYICFVDSDDYVSKSFVESLYHAISKSNCDLAICNFFFNTDGSIKPFYKTYKNEIITIQKNNIFEIVSQINLSCWNKIYKKNLLTENDIYQPEHRYYEGVLFWIKTVFYSYSICTISKSLYYYRQRPESIMTSYSQKHIDDRFEFIEQIYAFVKNNILQSQHINVTKIENDSLLFMMNQLLYGKTLLSESKIENREDLEKYYDQKIINFSQENFWPSLLVALRLYEENISLKKKLQRQNTFFKELKRQQSNNTL